MLAILLVLSGVLRLSLAVVTLQIPLQDQLPLIARLNQAYYWTFSADSFSTSTNEPVVYSSSTLPRWLSFDGSSRTFHGTPTSSDEGTPQITLWASDGISNVSCTFTICASSFPSPLMKIPLDQQFSSVVTNPSLSSVFSLAENSALATGNPSLRVPPGWSFSVGLDEDTFTSPNSLYYYAILSDGGPLPDWVEFNPNTVTFDGHAPHSDALPTPYKLPIAIHASDQAQYSAQVTYFDIVIADHELSANSSLPTLNITASSPFNITLASSADFSGILVDGNPIQTSNITSLSVDVSSYANWLSYDEPSRTLYGQLPANFQLPNNAEPTLPAAVSTNFNQTVLTNVSLNLVSSYFSETDLGDIEANPGSSVTFSLKQFVRNISDPADANTTASYFPSDARNYLAFDAGTSLLTGRIPSNSSIAETVVTFAAYSATSHSTSHAILRIVSPENTKAKSDAGKAAVTERVKIILAVVFGIIGLILVLGLLLALVRHYSKVRDSAVTGEEGTRAWTDDERKWYGLDPKTHPNTAKESLEYMPRSYVSTSQQLVQEKFGLGLQRLTPSASLSRVAGAPSRLMKKGDFLGKIKQTARIVSDKYRRKPVRPVISRPMGLAKDEEHTHVDGLPFEGDFNDIIRQVSEHNIPDHRVFYRPVNTLPSFTMSSSPSISTADRSIPRRRADFAPPRPSPIPQQPAPAVTRQTDDKSTIRASVQSEQSAISEQTLPEENVVAHLKPFTHSARVPVPKSASTSANGSGGLEAGKRIVSQTANLLSPNGIDGRASVEDLRLGMHYVRSLGEGDSTKVRSTSDKSFVSLMSSNLGRGPNGETRSRILVRVGERFKFRVPLESLEHARKRLQAKTMTGHALPEFLDVELKGHDGPNSRRVVEFSGLPRTADVGEIQVGIFVFNSNDCLAQVVVEVLGKNKRSPPMTA
ncbi:hypothetical protein CONPUDRAFT_127284 [Coniophora puteana RWD-64-598 SS2]|uniref:Dystroglycan-type cadherin-like domain-containing protein n=1 Tax=Coniophora puteana (strain RWD-64-598) TaxID=741705 RepID=A0A5M3ML47_CONPW|nr:uncharacterized protein CONPUDRAFT_127284 [Coniophora puteana RWD-64-598 SS2]EIW79291.1 hypothetical protein CONPUDRAFT_127284 [Coniophora puteana RWD-64-598 SS2]